MKVSYVEFIRCELDGKWDFSESDMKTYYEAKDEPANLDLWTKTDEKKHYKFKKGAIIRITSNIVRFNIDDTK
jgi:hypothetical protein